MTQLLMIPDGSLYLTDNGQHDGDSLYVGNAAEPHSWRVPAEHMAEAWRYYGISQGWQEVEFTARDEAEAAFTATAIGYKGRM